MNCKMRGVWAALAVLPGIAAAAPAPTPVEIAAAAPAGAWSTIPAGQLMLVDLGGASHRRVTIQLAPEFAPVHVANIRRLIAARAFEHTGVARVQDDYVVQWGDAARPPPAGLVAHPPAEYERTLRGPGADAASDARRLRAPRSASRWAGRSASIAPPAPPGWRIAMAWSASAATCRRIPARAPSCMP